MGKLLSLLAKDDSNCCFSPENYEIFLDFENVQPTENELYVYNIVEGVLKNSVQVLNDIQVYKVSLDRLLVFIGI